MFSMEHTYVWHNLCTLVWQDLCLFTLRGYRLHCINRLLLSRWQFKMYFQLFSCFQYYTCIIAPYYMCSIGNLLVLPLCYLFHFFLLAAPWFNFAETISHPLLVPVFWLKMFPVLSLRPSQSEYSISLDIWLVKQWECNPR